MQPLPQMLPCYIAQPHIFLYLYLYLHSTLALKQNCPAEATEAAKRKARREAGSLRRVRVVGWWVSVTLACLTGMYSMQYVCSSSGCAVVGGSTAVAGGWSSTRPRPDQRLKMVCLNDQIYPRFCNI